jgi:hypothetical protein
LALTLAVWGPVGARADEDLDGYDGDDDCDDQDPTVYPGAVERCDERDNNCDGIYLDGEVDWDDDGWLGCTDTDRDVDCDNFDATVYPGAPELCDGVDNNCDGIFGALEVDEDSDTWLLCEGDCDDHNFYVHLGMGELCDDIDNDCDGVVDELCYEPGDADDDGVIDHGCAIHWSGSNEQAAALLPLALVLLRRRRTMSDQHR